MLYEHLLNGYSIAMEAEDITAEAQQTNTPAKPFSKTGGGADDPQESNTDISTNVDNIYADDTDTGADEPSDEEQDKQDDDDSMNSEEDYSEEDSNDMDSDNTDGEEDAPLDEEGGDTTELNPEDEAESVKKENMRKNYLHLKEILEYNIDNLGDYTFDIGNNELRHQFSNIRDNFSDFYSILNEYLTEKFKDAPYEDIAKRYVVMKNLYEVLLKSLEEFITAASTLEEKNSKQKGKK